MDQQAAAEAAPAPSGSSSSSTAEQMQSLPRHSAPKRSLTLPRILVPQSVLGAGGAGSSSGGGGGGGGVATGRGGF
ncbi:B3 domain-containing protein Os02g0683500 [Drosophila grimshawi]|uniref:GH13034 n=1 Tax=Drosophila grimshawi TaxID=7222 RepID=B4JR90_DROGR|nr:B3 domain-containing protein Os02g0683500 [Drosophila grimshawi]EDV99420.1 GH13034 [Drosophila grimshawi]